ncbi:MAG: hypothetical protein AB7M05_17430 [Alphaproteobacteria bacterium]
MKSKTLNVIRGTLVVDLKPDEPVVIDGTATELHEDANGSSDTPEAEPPSPHGANAVPVKVNTQPPHGEIARPPATWAEVIPLNSPLARVGIPAHMDVREQVPDFTTEAKEGKEREKRLRRLKRGPKQEGLKRRLRRCSSEKPCLLPACPVCHRAWQVVVASQAAWLLAKVEKCAFVTLVAEDDLVRRRRLHTVDLREIKQRLSKRLDAVGLGDRLVFGGTEVTYASHFDRYIVHIHLLIADCSARRARRLRQFYRSFRCKVRDPALAKSKRKKLRVKGVVTKKVGEARELWKVSAYVTKGRIWSQGMYCDRHGDLKPKKKRRPRASIHTEMMKFLASQREQDFLILQRIRCAPSGRLTVHRSIAERFP